MLFKIFLFLFLFFSRFYGLNWGEGYFFHPDENNMARSVAQMEWGEFNPRFFAYGQFPLYLSFFSGLGEDVVRGRLLRVDFPQAVFWLRWWSAFFSLASFLPAFLLARLLFSQKEGSFLFLLFLGATPGLIQAAHFGTTESILVFVFLSLVYFGCLLVERSPSWREVLVFSLIGGIGLASKISALFFLFPPFLSFLFRVRERKREVKKAIVFFLGVFFFFFLFSPFYFLEPRETLSSLKYETGVARGEVRVFYTRQFINSLPLVFPLTRIFPWALGVIIFLLFLGGVIEGVREGFKKGLKKREKGSQWLVFHFSWLGWFLFHSFLFTKWTRFMTPIFPFLVLISVWFVLKLKERLPLFYPFVVVGGVLPGLIFLKVYLLPDVRWQASEWLNEHLPPGKVILVEGGNVVDLPLFNQKDFRVVVFDFYRLEEEGEEERLNLILNQADYFLSPSRRIFANHLPLVEDYPKTSSFYRRLFSGELGFVPLKEFKVFSSWEEKLVGSDLTAEETWTVFDHPTIRLFVKT